MRAMKDSGFEWIGEIPVSWELHKGKYMFTQRNLRGNNIELQLLSPTQKYGVVPQLLYEELSGMNAVKLNENANLSALKTIHKGDFCISLRSFQGGFEYSEYEGVVSPAYQVFYPVIKVARGYYKYLFKECGFIEKMNSYTMTLRDGKNIAFADFGNTYIPCPPITEQQRIADFLDVKCAEIDTLAADIQTQIDTLEQYKRSIITETVTKGLNPDAEMRDSGISWIGKIPSNWTFARIGSLYGLRVEKVSDRDYQPLSVTKFGVLPQLETAAKTNAHDDRKLVKVGDFAINSRSDRRGSCGISEYEGSVSLINTVLYPVADMSPQYYNWFFHTTEFADEFYRWGHGIVNDLWTTGWQDMKNIVIIQPPIEDQRAIAAFLDAKCAEIDSIIADKKTQLETLDAYKKSIIFEYVTGKKEVPSA